VTVVPRQMLRLGLRGRGLALGAAAAGALGANRLAQCNAAEKPPPPETPSDSAPSLAQTVLSFAPAPVKEAYENAYYTVYDNVVAPFANPSREKLLPDVPPQIKGKEKPTLVVSLDGCLIQSTWTRQHGWRYLKRPGVDQFLASLAPLYELVLWTETMNAGDPVVDKLDPRRLIRHRLYRDTTTFDGGVHRKDLSSLNRDLGKVLIIDVEAESFSFHPRHGIALGAYDAADDPEKTDNKLTKLVPFLQYLAITRPADFSAELEAVRKQFPDDDAGDACEKKLAELRAAGKIRARPGAGRGQFAAGDAAPRGGTIWERLRR